MLEWVLIQMLIEPHGFGIGLGDYVDGDVRFQQVAYPFHNTLCVPQFWGLHDELDLRVIL